MPDTLRVLNSLTEPRVGGPHLRSLGVATELREQGVETLFLLPDGSDEFEELATDHGFEVLRPGLRRMHPPTNVLSNVRYLSQCIPGVRRIRTLIAEHDIDVVHVGMTLNFQAAAAAHRSDTPLAWFFNDTGTPWPLRPIAAEMATRTADEIAVAADAVHEYFFSDSTQTRVIYPPVDTTEFDPAPVSTGDPSVRAKFDIDPDVPLLCAVGNLNPAKGHEYLLEATAAVRDQYGEVAVLVAGKVLDTRREYFERLKRRRAELGLDDTVNYLGRRSDIPRLLAAADLFVLSSVKEACPIAVLEAMAMERGVVATRVGGTPEQIVDGKHGWLVPPQNSATLADAMTDALQSPDERACRGRAARKRVRDTFSLERCAQNHLELYRATLNAHAD